MYGTHKYDLPACKFEIVELRCRRNGSLLLWTVDSGARSTAGSGPRGPPRPPEVPGRDAASRRVARSRRVGCGVE